MKDLCGSVWREATVHGIQASLGGVLERSMPSDIVAKRRMFCSPRWPSRSCHILTCSPLIAVKAKSVFELEARSVRVAMRWLYVLWNRPLIWVADCTWGLGHLIWDGATGSFHSMSEEFKSSISRSMYVEKTPASLLKLGCVQRLPPHNTWQRRLFFKYRCGKPQAYPGQSASGKFKSLIPYTYSFNSSRALTGQVEGKTETPGLFSQSTSG